MRYLKKFEKYGKTSLENEVNDILIDIHDDPNLEINSWVEDGFIIVVISLTTKEHYDEEEEGVRMTEEFKDSINRLVSYLDSEGITYTMEFGNDNIMPTEETKEYPLKLDDINHDLFELWSSDFIRIDIRCDE